MRRPTSQPQPVKRSYGGVAAAERVAGRRQQLLEAGFDLLAEGGPNAVTVSGVCKRASLTSRYFYEHFTDRDQLLDTIFDLQAAEVAQAIVAATQQAPDDPLARARAGVSALVAAIEADPRRLRVSRTSNHSDSLLRQRHAVTQRLSAVMAEYAELLWPRASTHPERIALASSLAVGGVLEITVRWLDGQMDLTREQLASVCARFALATGESVFSDE